MSNGAALAALRRAIAACVEAATDAETCDQAANPEWLAVRDAADECTDILRAVEAELTASAPDSIGDRP